MGRWNGVRPGRVEPGGAPEGVGHVVGRLTELRSSNLSEREKPLVRATDVFTAAGVLTGAVTGDQGARLARQAPDGAVPVETGSQPAPETPPQAASIQRSTTVLAWSTSSAASVSSSAPGCSGAAR